MANASQTEQKFEPSLIVLADILAADPEIPISSERSVDCSVLWRHYSTARDAAELGGDGEKAAVYNLLGGVCSMGLQAGEPLKPFTPLMAWAAGSTPSSEVTALRATSADRSRSTRQGSTAAVMSASRSSGRSAMGPWMAMS
ncbi:hypothetical protein [Ancylobacter sp. FA202]|uniref:DUF7380 domain-containing protein n=1 Tax=Ancylobacter sp. FA202 TaxID=1111106 RepID=UPI00037EF332|nr:hypothetical protein [Ancylobacter sp. FA202]